MISSHKKSDTKRKQSNAPVSDYSFSLPVYRYYVKKLKLDMKDVPKWLHCQISKHKDKKCVTNKKDPRYDTECEFILQNSNGLMVDENGHICEKPPRWLINKEVAYGSRSTSCDNKENSQWKEKKRSIGYTIRESFYTIKEDKR